MAKIALVFKGERDFAEASRDLGRRAADDFIRKAHHVGAQITIRHTRPLVPVGRTNDLRNSLRAAGGPRGGVVIVGDAKAFYARWVHNGTKRIKRQPFMYQGAARATQEVHDALYDLLGEAIEDAYRA